MRIFFIMQRQARIEVSTEFDTEEGDTVTAQRRARWRKAVEAGCQGPWAREVAKAVEAGSRRANVAKAVEAGSRRQETVDGGREMVKVDEEDGPI